MISDFMQTLLDRMDKFPEEFVDAHIDLTRYDYTRAIEPGRWSGITNSIFISGGGTFKFSMFTEEEQTAYSAKLRGILRKKLEQDICSALMEDSRQMELPFYSESIAAQLEAAALKIKQNMEEQVVYAIPTSILKDQ